MPKFNQKKSVLNQPNTVNRAGGKAYTQSDKQAFTFIALTSFLEKQFYRSSNETMDEIIRYTQQMPDYAMKLAIYARNTFNMRSVTHLIAGTCASMGCNSRSFFDKVVVRLDDMSEIISVYQSLSPEAKRKNGKVKLPKALKMGFRRAFNRFDDYQIAKYKMENRDWSLIDIVNMIRPVPTEDNQDSLNKLVNDELKQFDTWENEISSGGNWKDLLKNNKLGYMALLRNIRNILSEDESLKTLLAKQLKNDVAIKKSRIFPYHIYMAYKTVEDLPQVIKTALSYAIDKATDNVPVFNGKTLVALDRSGSMTGNRISGKSNITVSEIGGLLSAVIGKVNDADLVLFDGVAEMIDIDWDIPVLKITESIDYRGGMTYVDCIFEKLKDKYDQVIIFSDFQSWVENGWGGCGNFTHYKSYKKRCKVDPKIYSVDLCGYGTSHYNPKSNVFELAGFDTSMFDIMAKINSNKNALFEEIEQIEI